MRTAKKVLFAGLLGGMIVAGLYVNFALTAPGVAPSSTAGCVRQPDGTFTSNGRVCDRVDYLMFKKGLVAYVDPYFYHLLAEGWTFVNMSKGGSFFSFETHNLLTNNGVTLLQQQIHNCWATSYSASSGAGCTPSSVSGTTANTAPTPTTFSVEFLGLSASSTAPLATDTTCASEATEFNLFRTLGTYTTGSGSGGSISPALKATWTATGIYNNIQLGCAWNANGGVTANSGTTSFPQYGTLYAENTFSAVNLNSGDQLTITWTFTYSG